MEALVRWQHPEEGVVSPGMFISVAEETGLIHAMGEWILHTACHQAAKWRRMGLPPMRMAVNLSAQQFRQPGLVERIEKALEASGLEPHMLELEITESVFMENIDNAIEILVDLKTRAIQISIDDFGTGYSSLSYLKNFPIDRIKIAQDFVRDIPSDQDDAAIVETIIVMADRLGLKILAEGVETEEQMMFLQQRGCNEMQGYYFARPMPAEMVEAFLYQHGNLKMRAEQAT
jgi:EAL domain-containing protein (putative c-di-GMP-specific phosphodiesterase class I)